MNRSEAVMLFQADSPAWSLSRYYQGAAIRAAIERILLDGHPVTGSGAAQSSRPISTLEA